MEDSELLKEKNMKFLETFKVLHIKYDESLKSLNITLNRPKQLNALNYEMFEELNSMFSNIFDLSRTYDIRAIVIKGEGRCFSAGLDIKSELAVQLMTISTNTDYNVGKKSFYIYNMLNKLQNTLIKIEQCHIPVIALVHGFCLGGAISIISFCDVVLAEKQATFSIKEVDIGLVADLGILQRIQKIIGNSNTAKLWAFTGKSITAEEAFRSGLIQEVAINYEDLMRKGDELVNSISSKSPLILWGIKRVLNFSRDNSLDASLEHMRTLNQGLIQSDELATSIGAILSKNKPNYPKL